jgi:hypothetical protein
VHHRRLAAVEIMNAGSTAGGKVQKARIEKLKMFFSRTLDMLHSSVEPAFIIYERIVVTNRSRVFP